MDDAKCKRNQGNSSQDFSGKYQNTSNGGDNSSNHSHNCDGSHDISKSNQHLGIQLSEMCQVLLWHYL